MGDVLCYNLDGKDADRDTNDWTNIDSKLMDIDWNK